MNQNTKFAPRPPAQDDEGMDQQRSVPIWRTRIATVIMLAVASWGLVIAAIVLFFIF
ncbi:hypothetical protein SAMN04487974_101255 [Pelagibacterium luteolum]|uniref:Uncharacterized protein n=1 Tax=Pelagibacterium luteolum TaxID=440168 RepID=A0A1G7S1U4_9HYPH|nr:hypothetical protein SAMN04487974_101255 [Pelagibacterium luteolum]